MQSGQCHVLADAVIVIATQDRAQRWAPAVSGSETKMKATLRSTSPPRLPGRTSWSSTMAMERVTAAWRRTVEQAEAERQRGNTALSDALAEQRKRFEAAWDPAIRGRSADWLLGRDADRRVTARERLPERRSR
jgi:hypothetical protein